MNALWYSILIEIKVFLRSGKAAFWTFFFPIFLMLLFGAVFKDYINFLIPGLIGMVILSTAFYSTGVAIVASRQTEFLKRLMITPIKRWVFIAAHMANRFLIILFQSFLIILIAFLVFRAKMVGNPLAFLITLSIGILAFVSIGFLIASLAKTTETASGIANVLFLPMVFVSGAFFPVDALPKFLLPLVKVLPLVYLLDGLRAIYIDGKGLNEVIFDLVILGVWIVICFAISVKKFKWY